MNTLGEYKWMKRCSDSRIRSKLYGSTDTHPATLFLTIKAPTTANVQEDPASREIDLSTTTSIGRYLTVKRDEDSDGDGEDIHVKTLSVSMPVHSGSGERLDINQASKDEDWRRETSEWMRDYARSVWEGLSSSDTEKLLPKSFTIRETTEIDPADMELKEEYAAGEGGTQEVWLRFTVSNPGEPIIGEDQELTRFGTPTRYDSSVYDASESSSAAGPSTSTSGHEVTHADYSSLLPDGYHPPSRFGDAWSTSADTGVRGKKKLECEGQSFAPPSIVVTRASSSESASSDASWNSTMQDPTVMLKVPRRSSER